MPNPSLRSAPSSSMGLLNRRSQFLPPTSHTNRGSYVPILHNISQPNPPVVGSIGPIDYGHASQTLAYAWAQPQHPTTGVIPPELIIVIIYDRKYFSYYFISF